MDTAKLQRIIGYYYKQLYANKRDNIELKEQFLDRYHIPRLNQ